MMMKSPRPPRWRLDWPALHNEFAWIRAMQDCPQDARHHAEGDVWTHVRMVCEALAALPEWRALAPADRDVVFAGALLHDVAKPSCTRTEEDGRITARGHSQRGSIDARRILWERGVGAVARERVCALVRYHQLPFYLIDRGDALRMALQISQETRCADLALLARADALGRQCEDQDALLTNIALFEELCREQDCLAQPWAFPSPLSRFEYFRREDRDPHYAAHDDTRSEAIVMCGLPGSGKDTWLGEQAAGWPVISLDAIRDELGAAATRKQGHVVQTAKERARALLRDGVSFAWNATNLTRELRGQLVELFTGYRARVRIVHVEASYAALWERNNGRERTVPPAAIERMLERWEVPGVTEAPVVEWWENGEAGLRRVG